jgi:hypothetical protein
LANAAHVKNVPGRKTDANDATWLADLLAHGLIRSSFVPDEQTQEMRTFDGCPRPAAAGCESRPSNNGMHFIESGKFVEPDYQGSEFDTLDACVEHTKEKAVRFLEKRPPARGRGGMTERPIFPVPTSMAEWEPIQAASLVLLDPCVMHAIGVSVGANAYGGRWIGRHGLYALEELVERHVECVDKRRREVRVPAKFVRLFRDHLKERAGTTPRIPLAKVDRAVRTIERLGSVEDRAALAEAVRRGAGRQAILAIAQRLRSNAV